MLKTLQLLAAAAVFAGAPALADEATAPAGYNEAGQPVTNPADPRYDPDLIVCRPEDRTGSRAKRRDVCLSNRRWAAVERDGNRYARNLVEMSRAGGSLGF